MNTAANKADELIKLFMPYANSLCPMHENPSFEEYWNRNDQVIKSNAKHIALIHVEQMLGEVGKDHALSVFYNDVKDALNNMSFNPVLPAQVAE